MAQLFRQEVLTARHGSWMGTIHLATPLSRWVLAALAALIALAIVLFMIFGQYTQREHVDGQLVPTTGLLNVAATTGGIITQVDVKQGQRVHRGDALLEISGDTASASMGATRAHISERLHAQSQALTHDLDTQSTSAHQQRQQLVTQLTLLHSQQQQIAAQLDLQRTQVKSDQTLLQRIRPLEAKGFVSAFRVQQQQNALLQAQTQLKAVTRQRLDIAQKISQAQQQLAQVPLTLSNQRSTTQRQLDDVQQQLAQNEAQRAVVLRAQRDGVVSSLLVKAGQSVRAQQPLMSVLPAGATLQAQLLVPSRAAGFIDPGSRVVLRYQAYPYQKFGQHYGKVSAISKSALDPADVAALIGRQAKQPLYRVTVHLDRQSILAYGKTQPLKPGMALDADILMDRRSLIEWAFEPLYGLGRGIFDGSPAHG